MSCGNIIKPRFGWLAALDSAPGLEQLENVVRYLFCRGSKAMVRAVAEEALALTSLVLFLAMVAVWAQVLGVV